MDFQKNHNALCHPCFKNTKKIFFFSYRFPLSIITFTWHCFWNLSVVTKPKNKLLKLKRRFWLFFFKNGHMVSTWGHVFFHTFFYREHCEPSKSSLRNIENITTLKILPKSVKIDHYLRFFEHRYMGNRSRLWSISENDVKGIPYGYPDFWIKIWAVLL